VVVVILTPFGLFYTLRTVVVVRALRGADEGTRLVVRQHARDIDILNDLPPHLVAGGAYLLFLERFHLSGGGVADDYMVTGLAGQFAQTAPDMFVRQDPLSPELPEYVSEADVREAVDRAPYDPGLPEAGTT
jgi:hypothetical protein